MRDEVPRHQDQRSRGGQGPGRLLLRVPLTQAARRGGEAAVQQVTVAAAGEGRPEAAVVPCQSAAVTGAIGSEPAADVS